MADPGPEIIDTGTPWSRVQSLLVVLASLLLLGFLIYLLIGNYLSSTALHHATLSQWRSETEHSSAALEYFFPSAATT